MTKKLLAILFLICELNFSSYAQGNCSGFTMSGTTTSPFYTSQSNSCSISPLPVTSVFWTGYGDPNGFIKYTFNVSQTDVSIWFTIVNTDDFGTIFVNGGGVATLSIVNGCGSITGNVLGPYTGTGYYGDVLVNIKSTLPFTEITLFNTGIQSGQCSGDCSSVIINSTNHCNVQLGNDTSLCQGENMVLDATTNNATYLWQDNSTNPTFNVTQQGTYWVSVTVNNCTAKDTIVVNYNPLPIVNLGHDEKICEGDNIVLNATTKNASYLWQDNSKKPTFNVTQQGKYWVSVTINNCTTSDSINIVIDDCQVILDLPNLITANNDGMNDLFTPITSKGIVSMKTIIYGRWGNKVYETTNKLIDWNGENVSDGVYYWIVDYTDIKGNELSKNGYLTLVK